jgi:hypothetical protein
MAGGILLLVAVVLLAIAAAELYEDWQFTHYARSTQGTVLSKSNKASESSHRKKRKIGTKHYEATYRFAVDGMTYDGSDELTHHAWDRLKEGKEADVLYLPDHPSSSRLAGARPQFEKTLFGLIGIGCVLIGGVLLIRGRGKAPATV